MRKRNIRAQVWLNAREYQMLKRNAKKTCLSQETYLRTLINGMILKESPSPDYYAMMRELHAIGVNLNQIAAKANATGVIDAFTYSENARLLQKSLLRIQSAVELPNKCEGAL
ncbi:MAG: plasmid mobilization protein [Bacillota bacterium]